MAAVIFFSGLISYVYGSTSKQSFNEYDTYNADECQRIRRPWHKLTSAERDLYTSGLLQLRKNGNGNIDDDELISIGSVHEDPTAFLHQTSAYLYWHGYLVWELESRIRNLGGQWKCFGMPYWDFTLESGREDHPLILEQDIGGNGDPNNYWNVNGYSWSPTVAQYWVPNNCVSANDNYPLCSLKRALRDPFTVPTSQDIGDVIINNPNFLDFAEYSHMSAATIHLIDDHPDDMDGFPQAYEPIWYLFHSAIQFHQALWTDCNEYDLINVEDLDHHPDAFTPFCNSYNVLHNSCDTDEYPPDSQWYGAQWGLDDALHFGGTLGDKQWSYIYKHEVTVRELYMIPKWNIIYDLADGEGFYTTSGLSEYCEGKLNNHWFKVDGLNKEEVLSSWHPSNIASYLGSFTNRWLLFGFIVVSMVFVFLVFHSCRNRSKMEFRLYDPSMGNAYGSV